MYGGDWRDLYFYIYSFGHRTLNSVSDTSVNSTPFVHELTDYSYSQSKLYGRLKLMLLNSRNQNSNQGKILEKILTHMARDHTHTQKVINLRTHPTTHII